MKLEEFKRLVAIELDRFEEYWKKGGSALYEHPKDREMRDYEWWDQFVVYLERIGKVELDL